MNQKAASGQRQIHNIKVKQLLANGATPSDSLVDTLKQELSIKEEELQTTNEELQATNEKLQSMIQDMSRVNKDMDSLLTATSSGFVIMDLQMRILRFSSVVAKIINLIQGDIGRPLGHIATRLIEQDHLMNDVQEVLNTLVSKRLEKQTVDGAWFAICIHPYFTSEKVIEGAVITFQDITERKRNDEALKESRALLQAAMDQSEAGIAIAVAPSGMLRYVNDAGLLIRGGTRQSVVNGVDVNKYVASWKLLDLDGRPLNTDEVPLARSILFGEKCSREFVIRRDAEDDRVVFAKAAPIQNEKGDIVSGIVVFMDITERKLAEDALRRKDRVCLCVKIEI